MSDKIASKLVPIEKAEALPIGSLPSIVRRAWR